MSISREARRFLAGWSGLAAVVAALPFVLTSDYHLSVLNVTALNLIVVTGLNLLIGYAGQISLGHAAFFGLGAYGSAVLTTACGLNPWAAMAVTALGVACVAVAVGIPTLRLAGNYLVMATLGLNIIVNVVLVQWDAVTGGSSGLTGIPPLTLFGTAIASDRSFYWLVWAVAMGCLWPTRNLVHSPIGRALRALHDSPHGARACGVPTETYKVKIFLHSAIYASLAGSLYAHYFGIVTPKTFDIFKSVELVTMCLIGGMGSLWGGVFGAAFLTPLPQFLHVFEEYSDLIFGGVLLVILVFMPKGLFGRLEEMWAERSSAEELKDLEGRP